MTRRLLVIAATAGIVAGSAGLAAAATSTPAASLPPVPGVTGPQQEVCLVMSRDPQHNNTDDFCVTY